MKVEITCQGATKLPLEAMTELQGELKSLALEDYSRLRSQIIENGFSEPISIWRNGEKSFVLNGHQRLRALARMKLEGWEIPEVPVSIVQAENLEQAKKKLLGLASVYGRVTPEGLAAFLAETDIDPEYLSVNYHFPEIDMAAFTEEFFKNSDLDDPLSGAKGSLSDGSNSRVASSYIKMVQLLFNEVNHKQFEDDIQKVKLQFKIDNITDAVAFAVRKVVSEL